MKIGFTGTRWGMGREQMRAFYKFICELPSLTEFHHGACVGADAEAADTVAEIPDEGGSRQIIAHPGDIPRYVSFEAKQRSDVVLPEKQPLDRNRDIVDACELLVACPQYQHEERKSGTWMTVRYARKQKKRVVIIWPDGSVEKTNWPA